MGSTTTTFSWKNRSESKDPTPSNRPAKTGRFFGRKKKAASTSHIKKHLPGRCFCVFSGKPPPKSAASLSPERQKPTFAGCYNGSEPGRTGGERTVKTNGQDKSNAKGTNFPAAQNGAGDPRFGGSRDRPGHGAPDLVLFGAARISVRARRAALLGASDRDRVADGAARNGCGRGAARRGCSAGLPAACSSGGAGSCTVRFCCLRPGRE